MHLNTSIKNISENWNFYCSLKKNFELINSNHILLWWEERNYNKLLLQDMYQGMKEGPSLITGPELIAAFWGIGYILNNISIKKIKRNSSISIIGTIILSLIFIFIPIILSNFFSLQRIVGPLTIVCIIYLVLMAMIPCINLGRIILFIHHKSHVNPALGLYILLGIFLSFRFINIQFTHDYINFISGSIWNMSILMIVIYMIGWVIWCFITYYLIVTIRKLLCEKYGYY